MDMRRIMVLRGASKADSPERCAVIARIKFQVDTYKYRIVSRILARNEPRRRPSRAAPAPGRLSRH